MVLLNLPDGVSIQQIFMWLATWLGAGLVVPFRAGLAVASLVVLTAIPRAPGRAIWLSITLVVTLAGSWSANAWEAASGLSDDRRIVIDEVAGFAAAMAVIGAVRLRMAIGVAALFLALDRLKPWPFDRIEAVPGGLGVMMDDIALGLVLGLVALSAAKAASMIRGFSRR